jgi:hypothetical protein
MFGLWTREQWEQFQLKQFSVSLRNDENKLPTATQVDEPNTLRRIRSRPRHPADEVPLEEYANYIEPPNQL